MLDHRKRDFTHAVRTLVRAPGFSAIAVITLALLRPRRLRDRVFSLPDKAVARGIAAAAFLFCAAGWAAPAFASAQSNVLPCAQPIAADSDADALSDACERILAEKFAPTLIVRAGGCNWDAVNVRPGGGYFFAVQPVDSVIRIAYLPAYFQDCGWDGAKCWIPGVDCSPHAGDSEFIVVEVIPNDSSMWSVSGVFLSAHCFGRSGEHCRWYRNGDLAQFKWHNSAPVIWVAEGRQANYTSKQACDRGHHSLDTCDHNATEVRFPVVANRNVGSRARPFRDGGCVDANESMSVASAAAAVECFWSPEARFRGWSSTAPGVTGYYRYLVDIAGF